MSVVNTALDTGAVGDKIVRTADGAYLSLQSVSSGAPVLMDATDDAWQLPVGSKIQVTSTSPTIYFQADICWPRPTDLGKADHWDKVTTLAITTTVQTFLDGLDTFADLIGK
jgi:hypothetical protein